MTAFEYAMEPDEAVKSSIHEILRAYNREHFEILDEREIAITAKDDDGAVVGGVYGTMFGQWLEIEVLAGAPRPGRGQRPAVPHRTGRARARLPVCAAQHLRFSGAGLLPEVRLPPNRRNSGLPVDRQPALVRQGPPLIFACPDLVPVPVRGTLGL